MQRKATKLVGFNKPSDANNEKSFELDLAVTAINATLEKSEEGST